MTSRTIKQISDSESQLRTVPMRAHKVRRMRPIKSERDKREAALTRRYARRMRGAR